MAVPIVLGNGEILIQQGETVSGISSVDGKIQFGQVIMVYSGSDATVVDSYVIYDPNKAKQIMYGSTIYVIVKESDVSGTETPPG